MTFILMLAGCGGGGNSGGSSSEVVSGTAAVGAPLAGQVSIKDSATPPEQRTAKIAPDGSFAVNVTGMKAPYVLQAIGSADGVDYKLHSFSDGPGTANINPLSDVIVASAAGDDDPADVYEKSSPEKCHKIKTDLSKTVSIILAKLQPLLKHYNAENEHPITSRYLVNHLGLDDMFDKVKITVSKGTLTIINRKNNTEIFNGKLSDIANGIFDGGALPPLGTAPVAPTELTAIGGSGQVTLSWTSVSNATSYNVYYATTSGVKKTSGIKISPASTPYVHTGLAAGSTYFYIVTAVNSAGESAASAQASAGTSSTPPLPTVPAAPAGVIATGGTNQVALSWPAVSTATSYNVYYSTSSGVTKTTGTMFTNTTTSAVRINLVAGTTYYYIVTAVNSTGEGAASDQVSATTLPVNPSPTVPAAPAGVSAVGGTNQVTVSWTVVSGAASYNVYWSTATGVTTANGTKIVNIPTPYIHTTLTAGTTYYYLVTSVNSIGESASSAQVSAATNAPPAVNCTACHAIPPATGSHSFHTSVSCATCHGSGYSSTTVNAATHMNGVNNVSIGIWNASTKSCASSCHGSQTW